MKRRDSSFYFIVVSKKEMFHSNSKNRNIQLLKKLQGILYFYFILNYHFATAKYICINDNFLPLAYMKLKPETKLMQFWHGVGAFKKFGLSTETDPLVRKLVSAGNQQVDYQFVSATDIIPCFVEAMGIKAEHIIPLGIPVTDYYFQKEVHQEVLKRMHQRYPQTIGKKVLLYMPTFRKTAEENDAILKHFDSQKLIQELGEDYVLLIRMHPQIRPDARDIPKQCIDVTDHDDVKDLYVLSDLMIADYSSAVVEYALLNRPMIFYAYDLEQYDRGFYDPYEEMVPGPVVKNMDEVITAVKSSMEHNFDQKRERFLERHYDHPDGQATKRVVDLILDSK
jgi:Putative glycosyl/glycerophosphate transferases involved in teichoic acid biosynthesis TagF/TagB/EpsJ/RodC